MAIFLLRKAVPMTAFLLFFHLGASAQVSINKLYEEVEISAGKEFVFEATLTNQAKLPVEINIKKTDYLFQNNEHSFPLAGTTSRSSANWIFVEFERMLIPGERKVLLKFPVKIPADIPPGSYHSILAIETIPEPVEGNAGISITKSHAIQLVINVDSAKAVKKLEVIKVEAIEDSLFLTIRNSGEQILTFSIKPPIPGISADRNARIYPSMQETVELKIDELADGSYQDLRFIFDDGRATIIPAFITFRKGAVPTTAPLHQMKGESLRSQGRSRPLWLPRVSVVLTYGNDYRSASLSGNWRVVKGLTFFGSTNYREFSEIFDSRILNYRAGASINLKGLRLAYYQYWFQNSTSQMASANIFIKGFSFNTTYDIDREIIQGSISQNFFKRWSISFFVFHDFSTERYRYSASLVIPII